MMLASVDDLDEGLAILAYRATKEFSDGALWISGEAFDKCSILASFQNGGFGKSIRTCTDPCESYCEFNGKLGFIKYS